MRRPPEDRLSTYLSMGLGGKVRAEGPHNLLAIYFRTLVADPLRSAEFAQPGREGIGSKSRRSDCRRRPKKTVRSGSEIRQHLREMPAPPIVMAGMRRCTFDTDNEDRSRERERDGRRERARDALAFQEHQLVDALRFAFSYDGYAAIGQRGLPRFAPHHAAAAAKSTKPA